MPSYEIRVSAPFEAAHHLTAYRGEPEAVHGHSWEVEACVVCAELNEEEYGVDFLELQGHLQDLASRLHHRDINAVPPFDTMSPTAENLARWFWEQMTAAMPSVAFGAVTVREAPGCSVTYRP